MKKKHRLLALLVALSITAVTGCSSMPQDRQTSLKPYFSASDDNPLKKLDYVVLIDNYKVSPDEYRYVYENAKAKYTQGNTISDIVTANPELAKQIKDNALSMLQFNVATLKLAEENSVTLSNKDIEEVKSNIDSSIKNLGKEEFDRTMAKSYLNNDLFNYVTKMSVLKRKLYNDLFLDPNGKFSISSDEEVLKLAKDFIHAKHVLIEVKDNNWAAGEKKANEVYKKAIAGEDFDTLVKNYGNDPGMVQSPEGYYFKDGQMVEAFYQGAKALKENEISKPVKTEYGYHVIQRLPIEEQYVKENKDIFVSDAQLEGFYNKLIDYSSKQKLKFSEGYDTIGPDTFTNKTK